MAANSATSASDAPTPTPPYLILATTTTVTVVSKTGYQLIASRRIDPDRNYWRDQQKNPGRWPGQPVTDNATHV